MRAVQRHFLIQQFFWQRGNAALPEKMLSSENLLIWRFKVFVGD
jgi:hypothetical protein